LYSTVKTSVDKIILFGETIFLLVSLMPLPINTELFLLLSLKSQNSFTMETSNTSKTHDTLKAQLSQIKLSK